MEVFSIDCSVYGTWTRFSRIDLKTLSEAISHFFSSATTIKSFSAALPFHYHQRTRSHLPQALSCYSTRPQCQWSKRSSKWSRRSPLHQIQVSLHYTSKLSDIYKASSKTRVRRGDLPSVSLWTRTQVGGGNILPRLDSGLSDCWTTFWTIGKFCLPAAPESSCYDWRVHVCPSIPSLLARMLSG